MSQTMRIINKIASILNHKPSDSVSSRPSRVVRDSHQTIEGRCITNIPAGTITGLIAMLALPVLFIVPDSHAADSITVSISGDPSITVSPGSDGTFADSGNININVSNAPSSGYTLAIKGGGNTSLTGTTDSTKSITSISSAIDQNTFNTNTSYNNKWGYKPSMYYNTSTEQRANNSNYLPSPTSDGDIIDVTSDGSSNAYTLSIGARVTNTLGFQTYENNTFVIAAVGNTSGVECDSSKLCVQYEGNGLTYDGDTVNRVNYDSTTTQETVTKYSHTSNIGDDGTQNGDYPDDANTSEVVTIPGASSLHIKITYATESTSYDWAVIWAGDHPDYTADNDYDSGITCDGFGPKLGDSTETIAECDVPGDAVTFGFVSDGSIGDYGYYAIITGTATVPDRTVASGEYATPTGTNPVFHGWSTAQTTPGSGLSSDVEYIDEAAVMDNIPGDNGETKTLYAVWQQGQPITFTMDSNTSSVDIIDSDGTTVKTITTSGQTVALVPGNTYTIKPTHPTGYFTNAIVKISGAGTLNGKEFTVGAGATAIGVTSRPLSPMQNWTGCASLAVGDTEQLYDTRDNQVYLVGKLADNKCWMLDNLALDLTDPTVLAGLSTSNTNATDTALTSLRSGNRAAGDQYATAGVINWTSGNSYSQPMVNMDRKNTTVTTYGNNNGKVGGYYNYCAASAGGYCYGDDTSMGTTIGNATTSICPAGWRMPTGGTTGEYNVLGHVIYGEDWDEWTDDESTGDLYKTALGLPLARSFDKGSVDDQEAYDWGIWWSSTRFGYDDISMGCLFANPVTVNSVGEDFRYFGNSMRCIADS